MKLNVTYPAAAMIITALRAHAQECERGNNRSLFVSTAEQRQLNIINAQAARELADNIDAQRNVTKD